MAEPSALEEALHAVKQAPHAVSAWDELEDLAADTERPDDVVTAYREVLRGEVTGDVAEMLGERAGRFCDTWFGDDPKVIEGLLTRVLELSPNSETAVQRLSVIYTQHERWPDVLGLYDRALDATKDKARRVRMLREAAQLAKDVAKLPDRAIGYLQRLLPLVPDDAQLAHGLERLLERNERWADLIALWEGKLENQSKRDREKTRARIAGVWLDNLRDPARALTAIKPLLAEADDDAEASRLLERVIESPDAARPVREAALDILRAHYDSTNRPREVIRVLERVIQLDPAGSRGLREETGARLAELDDDKAAMDHYAALLALQPESSVTQEKLRQLAQRSNNYAGYAEGVATAGRTSQTVTRRVELLAEAARTKLDLLDDAPGAIDLYQEALAQEGAGEREQLLVCRRLSELYSRVDRQRERLDVLERMADLEKGDANRLAVVGEAARLAESLGDFERALALWQRRIDSDPNDVPALDARITLLEAREHWNDLVAALELRASKDVSAALKRSDLTRIATIHRDQRNDLDNAIAAWQRVARESGEDAESVSALADLLAQTNRWREMAELLERSSTRDTERTVSRLGRLGDAQRQHLGAPDQALVAYRNALAIDPEDATTRAGLTALLEIPTTRGGSADALADAFRRTRDWAGVLDLLPARLAEAADDPRTRLALLREAATIRLEHKADPAGALGDLALAFPLAPRDGLIEDQISRLAGDTGDHATASKAFAAAIAALADAPRDAARLRVIHGEILAERLDDKAGGFAAYSAAAAAEPGDRRAVAGVTSLAPARGEWVAAARTTVAHFAAKERVDEELIGALEEAAIKAGSAATEALVNAIDKSLTDTAAMPGPVAAQLHHRLAVIHREDRKDPFTAIGALRKALDLGGERGSWLAELVELERSKGPGRALLDALGRLAAADPRDLDALVESADVASKLGDRDTAITILGQVLGRATTAWRGTAQVKSSRAPEAVAKWAIDGLVELQRQGNARAAVDTLVEAARLPFDDTTRRGLRLRAADIASRDLNDNAVAIDMCRGALAAAPGDLEILDRLGTLLEAEDRVPELLGLRQLQLGLETDAERKLGLRLEIARLVGVVETRGGRLAALRTNLTDRPGHEASVDAIAQILAEKGQHQAHAALLEEQAQLLETGGEPTRAARLWARLAQVAERDTEEVDRAILAHRRVVSLAPTADAFRALARLNLERNQPAQAVPWFESLLAQTPAADKPAVVLALARAHLGASQPDRAIAAIEANLDDREPALELRALLAEQYRATEQLEPLARHLTRSLPLIRDDKVAADFAREAASIYTKLGMPGKAVPALETALALDPSDKAMRTALAQGLRVAGRLEEARTILKELVADFGRRRSPERAALHVELARVAQAEGKLDVALTEMEQASKMDVSNARIQKELAEMAKAAKQLPKAQRTYQALLLVVRRQPPGEDETAVGQSEVLFELHRLAAERGEADQAKELLESAIDAATQSDAEVRRLRRALLAHDQLQTLLKVIELRLERAGEAASQAKMLSDKADALDQLGRGADALDAMIKALQAMPGRVELHDKTRKLSAKVGQTQRYVEAVDSVVDRLRRKDDPPLVADLLMRAGDALEHDASDPTAAAALYRRVEMMGERLGETFYAQARVAGALGDTEEQARALDKMLRLAGDDDREASPAQIDALYRLAEIFLGTPARKTQGVDLIERAFAAEPRWAQTGRVLRAAAQSGNDDPRILALYERVARNGGDSELLLDFLERRANLPTATAAQIREAVDIAVDIGQHDRAEALLRRAVAQARDSAEGIASAAWAVLSLADRRIAANDLETSRDLVYEIAAVTDTREVDALAARIAQRAVDTHRPKLAAEVYEFLRERVPTERAVWQPLMTLYRELGDGDRLSSVVAATVPTLTDPAERNSVRLEHARFLIQKLKRPHDGLDVLREALADDPDCLDAAALLEQTLKELGDDEGMAEFLWSRFEDAQRRGNRASTVDVATRLGALLDATGSPDAGRVFRAALIVAPDDRTILREVVAHLGDGDDPRDRAALMERLLAVEEPDRVPALATQLATVWEAAGDKAGVQRTLELAHRSAPTDTAIHDRLEQWYRDNSQWSELADLMTRDAEGLAPRPAVHRLREAAEVYSGFLGQPLRAAEALRKARERMPDAPELATALAAALAAGGQVDQAQAAIGEALADITGAARTDLLLLRASLRQQLGQDLDAVGDLKEAYTLDPTRAADAYADGLERLRTRGETAGDYQAERTATLQLAQLLVTHGAVERARGIVVAWIERDPRDSEPLYLLCDMDQSIEHWDGVLAAATRLAYITEGDSQVEAGMRAADAATRAGHPADAVQVLELVHQAQPQVATVRAKLREFYELAGAYRELAGVLLADADHVEDVGERLANYRRAAELYLYQVADYEAATLPAQKALELSPDDHGTLMLYVDLLMGLGRVAEAGTTLEASIATQKKRTPELAVLQQRMGRVAALQGDKDGQLAWLKKAFDVDRKSGEIAAELAQLATEAGDYELALKPLRAITLMENPQPVTRPMALLWEAKIEHARGNRAKAELWAKKALREDPSFAEAQQFLDELSG